jgi:hypothetical protein
MGTGTKKILAKGQKAPQLQSHVSDKNAKPTAAVANDADNWKTYIAWCVAYYLYPDGDGVNEDQDISDNAGTNSDALALDVNYYATKLAAQYGYTWTNVTPAAVSRLKTVGDLEALVIANLAKSGA